MAQAATPRSSAEPPGGLSAAHFKALCADAGQWIWGTARGAFNDKASLSQIVVDAVIGMIPLVGDVTAARDLIAVVMGMIDSPHKRESIWEWVLLIVLLFALIPVFGGVIKGVGRILVKVAKEAELLAGAARAAHLAQGAKDIIAFLNRIGAKNAEKWFLALRIGHYEAQLTERFNKLLEVIGGLLVQIQRKAGVLLPAGIADRIKVLQAGIAKLKELGASMIPKAVKELDQKLKEVQAYVRSGGETTSRLARHEVAAGQRVVTRAEEARLVENGALPTRSARGWRKNEADALDPKSYEHVYKHESGYPDLTKKVKRDRLEQVEAFSGRLVNRELKEGEQIVRFFGPKGITHLTTVGDTYASGAWWWLGAPPKSAKEWREKAAVLDEFNRDGFMITTTMTSAAKPKAVVGTVAEQVGKDIPGQYLPGGGAQAFFFLDAATAERIKELGAQVVAENKAASWIDPISGMVFEVKPTGWTDANGVWGYINMPGQGAVQTLRLGAREEATKENREVQK